MEEKRSDSWPPPTVVPGWSDMDGIKKIMHQYRRLGHTEMIVSGIGFGAAHVNRVKNSSVTAQEAIRHAIRSGINLLDTSPFYGMGLSEQIVGQALKTVPRRAYYLCTKVGRHPDCSFDYSTMAVERSVRESLKRLNVDYIDLLHIHDVEFCPSIELLLTETLPTLERLRQQGHIRYIGITGYPLKLLANIVQRAHSIEPKTKIRIDAVLSYCRYTLWDDELGEYIPFFQSHGVGIINAAILGMGLLSRGPLPEWHPASPELKRACQRARGLCQIPHQNENSDSGQQQITTTKLLSRLALKHSLREPKIATHLIGMETLEMVEENLDAIGTGAELSDHEHQLLERILDPNAQNGFGHRRRWHWENIELERYRRDPATFIRFLCRCWSGDDIAAHVNAHQDDQIDGQ